MSKDNSIVENENGQNAQDTGDVKTDVEAIRRAPEQKKEQQQEYELVWIIASKKIAEKINKSEIFPEHENDYVKIFNNLKTVKGNITLELGIEDRSITRITTEMSTKNISINDACICLGASVVGHEGIWKWDIKQINTIDTLFRKLGGNSRVNHSQLTLSGIIVPDETLLKQISQTENNALSKISDEEINKLCNMSGKEIISFYKKNRPWVSSERIRNNELVLNFGIIYKENDEVKNVPLLSKIDKFGRFKIKIPKDKLTLQDFLINGKVQDLSEGEIKRYDLNVSDEDIKGISRGIIVYVVIEGKFYYHMTQLSKLGRGGCIHMKNLSWREDYGDNPKRSDKFSGIPISFDTDSNQTEERYIVIPVRNTPEGLDLSNKYHKLVWDLRNYIISHEHLTKEEHEKVLEQIKIILDELDKSKHTGFTWRKKAFKKEIKELGLNFDKLLINNSYIERNDDKIIPIIQVRFLLAKIEKQWSSNIKNNKIEKEFKAFVKVLDLDKEGILKNLNIPQNIGQLVDWIRKKIFKPQNNDNNTGVNYTHQSPSGFRVERVI